MQRQSGRPVGRRGTGGLSRDVGPGPAGRGAAARGGAAGPGGRGAARRKCGLRGSARGRNVVPARARRLRDRGRAAAAGASGAGAAATPGAEAAAARRAAAAAAQAPGVLVSPSRPPPTNVRNGVGARGRAAGPAWGRRPASGQVGPSDPSEPGAGFDPGLRDAGLSAAGGRAGRLHPQARPGRSRRRRADASPPETTVLFLARRRQCRSGFEYRRSAAAPLGPFPFLSSRGSL